MNLTKSLVIFNKLNNFLFTSKPHKIFTDWPCANHFQKSAYCSNMSKLIEIPVQTEKLLKLVRATVVPNLDATDINGKQRHKGQAGRIGVIGGSLEYTGAPYFSAISALRVGADLAHVFCQRDAAAVIKSYSPELIVHPVLDAENAIDEIAPWLERLHVLIVGPGLGRDPEIQKTTIHIIKICKLIDKPLIIDADGLFIFNEDIDLLKGYSNLILTPNAIEFHRLFIDSEGEVNTDKLAQLGEGVMILEKGEQDRIHIPSTTEIYALPPGGSGRRCGGQGDLLCGSIATFYHWALESNQANAPFLAIFAACLLVKECNAIAYKKLGRSMLAGDMVNEIHAAFLQVFEKP